MFRIKGLFKKGIALIFALTVSSIFVTYFIVDATHQAQLEEEFAKLKAFHQETTNNLTDQRLEQLILVAEEIYLLGGWETQSLEQIAPKLEELWPRLEMTFALSSMALKQGDEALIYGDVDAKLIVDMHQKTVSRLRPQSTFICRPTCSLVAVVPIFLNNQKASLFIASDMSPSAVSIKSVLSSEMTIFTKASNKDDAAYAFEHDAAIYASSVSTNLELTKTIFSEVDKTLQSNSQQASSAYSVLFDGVQLDLDSTQWYSWLTLIENGTDSFHILFTRDVNSLLEQQQHHQKSLLVIIGGISLGILAIISLLSYGPIQRLIKLKHTMSFIGDKKYSEALEALGKTKTGASRDEIDSLEREFEHSIDQLVKYEGQLLESQERLTKMATVDITTKLLNRNAFLEDMKSLDGHFSENETTLLFIDLDGFKGVNDNLGHVVGDIVLEQVGDRLKTLVEDGIRVYRIGGDEFLIALEKLEFVADLNEYCEQIVNIFEVPFYLEKHSITVTASIGVAVAGDNIASHIDLLKQADIAMYQAKDAGKNQYCFFDNMMMEQINLRYIINSQFPESLATNQISLVFQPIVDANSGKLIKLEALSRWVHPEIGFIRPDKFIQILEETTHIDTLSEWLISQAAAKVNELDELGLTDVVVSINISGAQVSDIDSIGILMVECTKANVEYNRIELEITETSLISDFKKAQDWISKVNSMGFRIAIDDFGTGYSSLSYLTAFPFDCVKLDRSLLLDVEESQRTCNIVRSITSMIHSMDVPVVAEGIETLSHLEVIKSLGCDYVQGYYFSRPLAAKDLKLRLEEYVDSLEWKAEASN